jgi:flagellar basal body-associated protein FliL
MIERPLATERAREAAPDKRANRTAWIAFAAFCALLLVGGLGTMFFFGVPGSTGGTSPSQQQTSGAPQPKLESTFGNAGTQETTGYGAPQGARPPREGATNSQ